MPDLGLGINNSNKAQKKRYLLQGVSRIDARFFPFFFLYRCLPPSLTTKLATKRCTAKPLFCVKALFFLPEHLGVAYVCPFVAGPLLLPGFALTIIVFRGAIFGTICGGKGGVRGVGQGMELVWGGCVESEGTTVDHWHLEVRSSLSNLKFAWGRLAS